MSKSKWSLLAGIIILIAVSIVMCVIAMNAFITKNNVVLVEEVTDKHWVKVPTGHVIMPSKRVTRVFVPIKVPVYLEPKTSWWRRRIQVYVPAKLYAFLEPGASRLARKVSLEKIIVN